MKNKKVPLLWLLTVVWTALLFVLSAQSGDESARLSGGLTAYILNLFSFLDVPYLELEHFLRKLAHFCMFGLEGLLAYLSLKNTVKRHAGWYAAAGCGLVAALNEYQQVFSEGRSAQIGDVVLDFAGAVLGMGFAGLCYYYMKSRRGA